MIFHENDTLQWEGTPSTKRNEGIRNEAKPNSSWSFWNWKTRAAIPAIAVVLRIVMWINPWLKILNTQKRCCRFSHSEKFGEVLQEFRQSHEKKTVPFHHTEFIPFTSQWWTVSPAVALGPEDLLGRSFWLASWLVITSTRELTGDEDFV